MRGTPWRAERFVAFLVVVSVVGAVLVAPWQSEPASAETGVLDAGFDGDGMRPLPPGGGLLAVDRDVAVVVALDPPGRMVPRTAPSTVQSWRIDAVGAATAIRNGPSLPPTLEIVRVVPRPGGGVLVGAATPRGTPGQPGALVALRDDGSGDPTFGTAGVLALDVAVLDVATQPDGRIVVAGERGDRFVVRRLLGDGSLDVAFAGGTGEIGQPPAWATVSVGRPTRPQVRVTAEGSIVVNLGSETENGERTWGLSRFQADGSPDPTFGTGGTIRTAVWDAIAIASGGRLLVRQPVRLFPARPGGTGTWTGGGWQRLLPDGQVDPAFGAAGVAPVTSVRVEQMLELADGRLLGLGGDPSWLPNAPTITRFRPDGTPDPAFDDVRAPVPEGWTDGRLTAIGGWLRSDGRLLVHQVGGAVPVGAVSVGAVAARPEDEAGDSLTPATLFPQPESLAYLGLFDVGASNTLDPTTTELATVPVADGIRVTWSRSASLRGAAPLTVGVTVTDRSGRSGSVVVRGGRGTAYVDGFAAGSVVSTVVRMQDEHRTFTSVRLPDVVGERGFAHAITATSPERIVDTRLQGGPFAPGETRRYDVNSSVLPPEVWSALVVNLTVTNATGAGFVTAWAADRPRPATSNLNVERVGQTIANLAVVPMSPHPLAEGTISIFSQGGGHLVVDVIGAIGAAGSTAGRTLTVPPTRLLDTRTVAPLLAGGSVAVPVGGRGGVPATGAAAVWAKVTLTEAAGPGFLTVWPSGGNRPVVSTLNAERVGQTVPNLTLVPLGADGTISVFSQSGGQVLVDVVGYVTDDVAPAGTRGFFVPREAERVLDSRIGLGTARWGRQPAGEPIDVVIGGAAGAVGIPTGASGFLGNLTMTDTTGPGYVAAWATGTPRPSTSVSNLGAAGQTFANAVVGQLGAGGLSLFAQPGASYVLDVAGYFTG